MSSMCVKTTSTKKNEINIDILETAGFDLMGGC